MKALRLIYKDGYEDVLATGYRETIGDRLEIVLPDGTRRYVMMEWIVSYGWV